MALENTKPVEQQAAVMPEIVSVTNGVSADGDRKETAEVSELRVAGHAEGHNQSTENLGRNSQDTSTDDGIANAIDELETKGRAGKGAWFAYLKTRDFYIVLTLGQVLALCITATNTFSTKLVLEETSVPAFQTLFVYVLLTLVYTTYTVYRYGFKKYFRLLLVDGWKYIILSFFDVEGNYFTVLCYRYTTIMSAQLLNFWAIVCVVLISFFVLKVRYRIPQIIGILVACGGVGILLASDHLAGQSGVAVNELKGDLFGLAGATFYGLANVYQEWWVSKRPMYEVLGMIGLFGIIITPVQLAIFDRVALSSAHWTPAVGGYLVGYTLCMSIFYSLAPIVFRMASAAFYNISLLTGNFWGTIIGIRVFGYTVHFLYPIAFVCIIIGQIAYFLTGSMLGDSKKPWLGAGQEDGVEGLGTAKRKAKKLAEREREEATRAGSAV